MHVRCVRGERGDREWEGSGRVWEEVRLICEFACVCVCVCV